MANIKSGKPFDSKTGVQFSSGGGYTTDLSTATTDLSTATTDLSTATTDFSTNYFTTDYSTYDSTVNYTPISSTSFTSIFTSGYGSSNNQNSSNSSLLLCSFSVYFIALFFTFF